MGTVPVRDLAVGAVLEADVTDRSGRILLRSGATIDDRQLRILQMWGVTEVDVVGGPTSLRGGEDPVEEDLAARAEEETADLFAQANRDHPAMQELARLSTMRSLRAGEEADHGS